jgi:membrane-bound lytic murein transglycosylase D
MASLNAYPLNERLDAGVVLSLPVTLNQNSENAIINPVNLSSGPDDDNSARRIKMRYKVKRGDNVASIARKFHISTIDIYSWNSISSKRKLARGTVLTLYRTPIVSRASVQVAAKSKGIIRYKVKRGENMASIADKFDVTVLQLQTWNKRATRHGLHAGRVLAIYTGASGNTSVAEPTEPIGEKKSSKKSKKQVASKKRITVYTIKKGDSLWNIARAFNVQAKHIALYNDITVKTRLVPGTTLKVPLAEEL